ncbi:MAG: hypothetical protein JWP75_3802 [Frondihabitans sp.]|nr:hypothetical protein [Frondihabitans sp.]
MTSRVSDLRSLASRRTASRALYLVAALGIAVAVATAATQPASATATDGSDWGPGGVTRSDSATTVSWDNNGNPTDDIVPRNGSQVLPYTGGSTYDNTDADYRAEVKADFRGMKLSVSQTSGLVHQGVQVSLTGVGDGVGENNGAGSYIDVFQCWGSGTVDGKYDTSEPDPEHCETGVGGVDQANHGTFGAISGDTDTALIAKGNLKAVPSVKLTAVDNGTNAVLTASLLVQYSAADGAAGTVTFSDANGKAVASGVAVVNGVATTTVALTPNEATSFTAAYTATRTENYADSAASTPAAVPVVWDTGATNSATLGSVNAVSYPAGSFGDSKAVTASLDGGAPSKVATTDAFGGLAFDYTIPSGLVVGSTHSLALTDGTHGYTARFVIPTPTVAQPGIGTNTPDQTPAFPFVSINGSTSTESQAFTTTTTNEFAEFNAAESVNGSVSRTFEMQTGSEESDLGCGRTSLAPSTSTCWLVAVPYPGATASLNQSPLSPSQWANRVQVKLHFADVAPSCSGSQARTLAGGTELLDSALASWTPAICSTDKVSIGYATIGDQLARSQYASGQQNVVFTSQPIDDQSGSTSTVYAPVALTGVTIGYHLYDATTGKPVPNIRLNARLVARLLTESYQNAIDSRTGSQLAQNAPWAAHLPYVVTQDSEFLKLNPDFPSSDDVAGSGELVVSSTLSDATSLLWNWIVNDKAARAFLDGCDGTINPFYSTRAYAECPSQAKALAARANAEITETKVPSDFNKASAPTYPPTEVTYPQPGWYQRNAVGTGADAELALSVTNMHPRESTLGGVGADVFEGIEPTLTSWCPVDQSDCAPVAPGAPGKWQSSATKSLINGVFGVTDTSTTSIDQVTTASLCDDSGHCVGANTASLTKAASEMVPTGNADVVTEPSSPDIAGGAYPLALPVYAEVNTQGLTTTDATPIATILGYMSTTGQNPGYDSGQLPPGYAPLPAAMVAQTQSAISTLNTIGQPKPAPAAAPAAAPASVPSTAAVPVATSAAPAPPTPVASLVAAVGTTPATPTGFPRLGVMTGLGGAIAAGAAAPIVGRRRRGVL